MTIKDEAERKYFEECRQRLLKDKYTKRNIETMLKEPHRHNLRMLIQLFNYSPIPEQESNHVIILENPETKRHVFYNPQTDAYSKPTGDGR